MGFLGTLSAPREGAVDCCCNTLGHVSIYRANTDGSCTTTGPNPAIRVGRRLPTGAGSKARRGDRGRFLVRQAMVGRVAARRCVAPRCARTQYFGLLS